MNQRKTDNYRFDLNRKSIDIWLNHFGPTSQKVMFLSLDKKVRSQKFGITKIYPNTLEIEEINHFHPGTTEQS